MMPLTEERSSDEADKEAFNILYSWVPTEATTDVGHAKKDGRVFSHFKFNENARMLFCYRSW